MRACGRRPRRQLKSQHLISFNTHPTWQLSTYQMVQVMPSGMMSCRTPAVNRACKKHSAAWCAEWQSGPPLPPPTPPSLPCPHRTSISWKRFFMRCSPKLCQVDLVSHSEECCSCRYLHEGRSEPTAAVLHTHQTPVSALATLDSDQYVTEPIMYPGTFCIEAAMFLCYVGHGKSFRQQAWSELLFQVGMTMGNGAYAVHQIPPSGQYCKSVRTCVRQKKGRRLSRFELGLLVAEERVAGDCLFYLTHV